MFKIVYWFCYEIQHVYVEAESKDEAIAKFCKRHGSDRIVECYRVA